MAIYSPAYPANVPLDAGIKDFITTFYGVSDTPGKNAEWAGFFRDDATVVMAKEEATGRTDIIKMREGMWEKVEARKHTVNKVFPASFREGGDADADEIELMLFGNVEYSLKGAQGDGGAAAVDWAGYAKLKRTAGEWKFAYYRVYLQK